VLFDVVVESDSCQPVKPADAQAPLIDQIEAGEYPTRDVGRTVAQRDNGFHDLLDGLKKFGGKLIADRPHLPTTTAQLSMLRLSTAAGGAPSMNLPVADLVTR
jgi:hypothetical protein